MSLLSYFKFVDTTWVRDNSGKLGLLIDTDHGKEFYYFGTGNFNQLINSDYFRSFSCQIDVGSCVFTKEFRKSGDTTKGYWYASKKINGKLHRVYFGCKSFTLDTLEATLAKFSTPKKETVTQEVTQKSFKDNGSKTEFINDFAVGDRVAYANPVLKYQENRGIGEVAEVTDSHLFIVWQDDENMLCPMPKRSRDKLILVAGHGKSDRYLQPSITDKILAANQEKIKSLENEVNSLMQERDSLREKVSNLEDYLKGCEFVLSGNRDKIAHYQATIDKYQLMSFGKTKKDNPRYAYLIDFLAEIDKLF